MNVKSHIVVLELGECQRQISNVLYFDQWGENSQTMLLIFRLVEKVDAWKAIWQEVNYANCDELIVEIILHVVTALMLCDCTCNGFILLMCLYRIECWLVMLLSLFYCFFFLTESQCTLTQEICIWAESFFFLTVNFRAVALIHFPAFVVLLCLY